MRNQAKTDYIEPKNWIIKNAAGKAIWAVYARTAEDAVRAYGLPNVSAEEMDYSNKVHLSISRAAMDCGRLD